MSNLVNIYCDESCHLENDNQKAMILGGIVCPDYLKKKVFSRIREIKVKHKLGTNFEIKWTKVSMSKIDFYMDIIDYFFDSDNLSFRGLIVPDKSVLKHKDFNQSHDEFYYKMYYCMLKEILYPDYLYNIYLDFKDTNGYLKIQKLNFYLKIVILKHYSLREHLIKNIQEVRSHEVELIQLADLIIGAISYKNRGYSDSKAKIKIIERIEQRGYPLDKSTLPKEEKFNLFKWHSRGEY